MDSTAASQLPLKSADSVVKRKPAPVEDNQTIIGYTDDDDDEIRMPAGKLPPRKPDADHEAAALQTGLRVVLTHEMCLNLQVSMAAIIAVVPQVAHEVTKLATICRRSDRGRGVQLEFVAAGCKVFVM